MKEYICTAAGVVGSFIASLFGGWDWSVTVLIIFMAVDYITGIIAAGVFHTSPKTKTGTLESRAGFKGLCRKGEMLLIVLTAACLDKVAGTDFIRDCAVIAFIVNEAISVTENAGLIGIPIPKVIVRAIEILKQRSDGEDK